MALDACSGWELEACLHHILVHPGRGRLAALETCSDWKGGDHPSSVKSLLFVKESP